MAGGYTHLTLVRNAITASRKPIPDLQEIFAYWGRYTYLGGVSPDYPYLGLDADWADLMHKGKTNQMIRCAMPIVHQMRVAQPDSQVWRQQFAWLLGFVTHIIADVTIHPVVNIRVGKYEQHKEDHRHCEMNQDVWIYKEITGIDLHVSDNMKSEIRSCGTGVDLNDDVENLWKGCLEKAYSPRKLHDDQIDRWHAFFVKLVDLAEVGRKVPVFGRHMASGALAYPAKNELDSSFYKNIKVPISSDVLNTDKPEDPFFGQPKDSGNPTSFRAIFDKTSAHILEAWKVLSDDMFTSDGKLGELHETVFGDWSLDTGIDKASKQLRFWPWGKKLI